MREGFHQDIGSIIATLASTGADCEQMLDDAVQALVAGDRRRVEEVAARDLEVDRTYQQVQQSALRLLALQAPVARDLRVLTAALNVNIHIERMGDYAVHVARAVRYTHSRTDPGLLRAVEDMSAAAVQVSRRALRSFAERDPELARQVPSLDDRVDDHNVEILGLLLSPARAGRTDRADLEWATRMAMVARAVERFADHAVDISEQTVFAVTGDNVEFSSSQSRAV